MTYAETRHWLFEHYFLQNLNVYTKFPAFRCVDPDFAHAQFFATEFSGSSQAQNLKLHIFIQVLAESY